MTERNYDLCLFSSQALINDRAIKMLVLYMGDGWVGNQTISIRMKGQIYKQNTSME